MAGIAIIGHSAGFLLHRAVRRATTLLTDHAAGLAASGRKHIYGRGLKHKLVRQRSVTHA
jgi:hypothetical protein